MNVSHIYLETASALYVVSKPLPRLSLCSLRSGHILRLLVELELGIHDLRGLQFLLPGISGPQGLQLGAELFILLVNTERTKKIGESPHLLERAEIFKA